MEARHGCKLCFRNFANGRALGGHMRSHMMKFYAAKKQREEEFEEQQQFDDFQSVYSYSSPSSSSSSSEDEEDEDEEDEVKALLSYELRENPKKSAVLVDHELSFTAAAGSVVLQDGESETESLKKKDPIYRRSKRVRKSRISDFDGFGSNGFDFGTKKSKFDIEYSSLSSISDTTPEEHVAHCLIMLSKDNWKRDEKIEFQEDYEEENEKKFGNDCSEDYKVIKTTKVRGKYRCEECNKLFKSYQALGGHRASHKKIKVVATPPRAAEKRAAAAVVEEKIHECPFCHRIFSSGQALGGHKRSHFIGGGAISANVGNITTQVIKKASRINNGEAFNIDLNLPAPVDDDETTSQIAVSALSDAEFVHPIK